MARLKPSTAAAAIARRARGSATWSRVREASSPRALAVSAVRSQASRNGPSSRSTTVGNTSRLSVSPAVSQQNPEESRKAAWMSGVRANTETNP